MANNARAGTVYVRINGTQHDLGGSVTVGPMDIERESLVGVDSIHGFKEMPKAPFIEVEFVRNKALSIQALKNIVDSTITAELVDGSVYVLRNAWYLSGAELDAVEGKYTARFEGLAMQENL